MSHIHFSDEELAKILKKNPKLKISKSEQQLEDKTIEQPKFNIDNIKNNPPATKDRIFSLGISAPKKKKVTAQTNLTRSATITSALEDAKPIVSFNDNYFSMLFPESKLLTVNDLFTLIQSPKKQGVVWQYKKTWHNLIKKTLKEQTALLKDSGGALPFFDDTVELTLFRQAPSLVDKDALTTMFKYIIDAFKYDKEDNPFGILADDNPNIVHKIRVESNKAGTRKEGNYVGIRIKKIVVSTTIFLPEDILKEDS